MHRVLLARTLINEPRIVLLDEPWEGLDQATKELVSRQIRAAIAAGVQIVCASHIVDDRLQFSHRLRIVAGRAHAEKTAINADGRAALREN
jgi:ABC-type molybdenum transport system ATPase subunit/photorepair protein PhrA